MLTGAQKMTKRDHGTFVRACVRILSPMVAPLGYNHLGASSFARPQARWREGFFLQKSLSGVETFCVCVGIDVPEMRRILAPDLNETTFAATLGGRLSLRGVGMGDNWFPADSIASLARSLQEVAELLHSADAWFAQFKSLDDIAQEYFRTSNINDIGNNSRWKQVFVSGYAVLLYLGSESGSSQWLYEARRCITDGDDSEGGPLRLDDDERVRLRAIEALLGLVAKPDEAGHRKPMRTL